MKQLITLVAVTCVLCGGVYSQSDSASWNVGILIGANGSNLVNDNLNSEAKFTITAGIRTSYQVLPSLSVGADVQYRNKKFGEPTSVVESDGTEILRDDIDTEVRCISIPAWVRYSYGNKLRVYGGAGLGVDFVVQAKRVLSDRIVDVLTDAEVTFQEETITSTDYNTAHLTVGGQAGIQFPLTDQVNVDLGAQYHRSITEIAETAPSDAYFESVQVVVGLMARF